MAKGNNWIPERVDQLIKIAMIYTFNAFSVRGTRRIYEYCSRLNHSCSPNCRVDFPSPDKLARAMWTVLTPIKAGDEMTASYGGSRFDFKTTFNRHEYYIVPPVAFVNEMLTWERTTEHYRTRCVQAVSKGYRDPWHIYYPDCHLKSHTVSAALFELSKPSATKLLFAKRFIKPIELLVVPPNPQHVEWFLQAANMFLKTRVAEGMHLALKYARRAVRDMKILHGRETLRLEGAEKVLCAALYKLPYQTSSVTECMFCGEEPENACLTLSKCSGCKKVTYCGQRCQMAHWRFHKSRCGKVKWNPRRKSCERWDAMF
eukprot:gene22050-28145_t